MNPFLASTYLRLLVLFLVLLSTSCFTASSPVTTTSTISVCVSTKQPRQTSVAGRNIVQIAHWRGRHEKNTIANGSQYLKRCTACRRSVLHFSYSDSENNTENNKIDNDDDTDGREKAAIILYRISLLIGSFACGLSQIMNVLQGSGLSVETISNIQHSSDAVFTWGILFAALVIPKNRSGVFEQKKNNGGEVVDENLGFDQEGLLGTGSILRGEERFTWSTLVNNALPYLSSLTILIKVVNEIHSVAPNEILDEMTTFFISVICLREIGYFGAAYKVEAILAICLVLISSLGIDEGIIGFPDAILSSLLALCLLVLSFGKVFEPLQDDLRPNGSAFFKDDAM